MSYPIPDTPRFRRRAGRGFAVLMAAGLAFVGCGDDGDDASDSDDSQDDEALAERQDEVAERGEEVMPFDLDATYHQFGPLEDGIYQMVIARDPDDTEQIELIRDHLAEEAEHFSEGDYSDPAAIHGEDMPGLAELEAGADAITIETEDMPAGGRINYTTADPELVDALSQWAEAQTEDHGEHAEHEEADADAG